MNVITKIKILFIMSIIITTIAIFNSNNTFETYKNTNINIKIENFISIFKNIYHNFEECNDSICYGLNVIKLILMIIINLAVFMLYLFIELMILIIKQCI
jgi:hypothetical protein